MRSQRWGKLGPALVVPAIIGLCGCGAPPGSGSGNTLRERTPCAAPSDHGPAAQTSGPTAQVITVKVPRIAVLRLDTKGTVVAAMTSTGCAPRVGDTLYTVTPDGTTSEAPTVELAHRTWTGDFREAGVFVTQKTTTH